jgi:elongation factor P
MKANDIKPGQVLNLDGTAYLVTKTENVKPGKGGAFVQTKLKSIKHGNVTEKRFRSVDDVEATNLDKRDVEYLYQDSSGAVFMDGESYEQFTIPEDILGDTLMFIRPNESVKGMFLEGQCITVELPPAVELTITETEPGIKNATATNVMKEAVCETGLKVRVPPFIKEGEVVKINTDTREYLNRVN